MKINIVTGILLLGAMSVNALETTLPVQPNMVVAETLGAIAAEVNVVRKSTVIKINHKTREVTLKGEDGKENSFIAPLEIRNLAQVKKGDVVIAENNMAMSIQLLKNGTSETGMVVKEVSDRAKLGDKPAAMTVNTAVVRYNVTQKDMNLQTITLEENGNLYVAKIKKKEQFNIINVGDQVEVTQVSRLSIRTVTPKK